MLLVVSPQGYTFEIQPASGEAEDTYARYRCSLFMGAAGQEESSQNSDQAAKAEVRKGSPIVGITGIPLDKKMSSILSAIRRLRS